MNTFNVDLLRQSSDDGPVTMINLIKYRPHSLDGDGTGREAYARYTTPVQKLVEERGGRVLWAGPVAEAAPARRWRCGLGLGDPRLLSEPRSVY